MQGCNASGPYDSREEQHPTWKQRGQCSWLPSTEKLTLSQMKDAPRLSLKPWFSYSSTQPTTSRLCPRKPREIPKNPWPQGLDWSFSTGGQFGSSQFWGFKIMIPESSELCLGSPRLCYMVDGIMAVICMWERNHWNPENKEITVLTYLS